MKRHGIDARTLLIIQGFKQARSQEERDILRPFAHKLPALKEAGYLKQIKGKSSDDEFSRYRIDSKGRDFLRDLEVAGITDDTIALSGKLYNLYKDRGHVNLLGNKKELVRRVTWFVSETGFDDKDILATVEDHLNQGDYHYKLNNLLYKAPNVYKTGYNLAYSPLYSLMTNRE